MGASYATFGSSVTSRGFNFTISPGVQPSVCNIETIPQSADFPSVATLTIKTNGGPTLTFRDCLLEDPKFPQTKAGKLVTLPIKDRRWMWQFGYIYGHFNKPEANGTYTRETTPQDLALSLFAVLNESNPDVSRLPNVTRPEKRWDGAHAATELDALCTEHSCVVVLNPFNDRAEIWPIGVGVSLPSGGALSRGNSPVRPAQPSKIKLEAAETLFQATFPTEPVGLDVDGTWRHIDSLSYRPSFGWGTSPPWSGYPYWPDPNAPDFEQLYTYNGRSLKIRDLAEGTVYRCYRLTGIPGWLNGCVPPLLTDTFLMPADFRDLRFFNELADEQITTGAGPQQDGLIPMESRVYARWGIPDRKHNPLTLTYYQGSHSFDTSNWIISFGEPLFLFGATSQNNVIPAEVQFECSFFAGAGGIHHRRSIISSTSQPPSATPMLLIQRPDVQARAIYRFDATGHQTTFENNFANVDQSLNYWTDAVLKEYGLQQGGTVTYPGLVSISPDGLTQQVTWSGGGKQETTTTASQAQRHNRFVPPREEYRRRLAQRRNDNLMQQLIVGQLAKSIGGGL
jgi:hypothetical protein